MNNRAIFPTLRRKVTVIGNSLGPHAGARAMRGEPTATMLPGVLSAAKRLRFSFQFPYFRLHHAPRQRCVGRSILSLGEL